jgi:hypothetical protein
MGNWNTALGHWYTSMGHRNTALGQRTTTLGDCRTHWFILEHDNDFVKRGVCHYECAQWYCLATLQHNQQFVINHHEHV